MEFVRDEALIVKDFFHITGNEDDCSFHYGVVLQDITITKTLITSNDDDAALCRISIRFPSYKFVILLTEIAPIIDVEITEDFVKNYNANIGNDNDNNQQIYSIQMIPHTEFKPQELDQRVVSDKLFNIYMEYYQLIKNMDGSIRRAILNIECDKHGHCLIGTLNNFVACVKCTTQYSCSECYRIADNDHYRYGGGGRKQICEQCYKCKRKIQRSACKTCELPSCYCGHPCGCTC